MKTKKNQEMKAAGGHDGGHQSSTSIPLPVIIGHSLGMRKISEDIQCVASEEIDVLIHGETGSGKELIARSIHCLSPRGSGQFAAVNCAVVTESLFESEFFGAEVGAFTGAVKQKIGWFEKAHGGSLFLDEISEIGCISQAKLLRAIQERTITRVGGNEPIAVDVRVISATNVDI